MGHVPEQAEYATPQGLRVIRLQPAIGAVIQGADLSQDLTPALLQDLRSALLAHGVIFFRDQAITYEQHVALGEAFGDLVRDHGADPDRPEIFPVKTPGGVKTQSHNRWHSDGCYMACPPAISVLRAIDVKPFGGDTCFSSGVAAYEGLSDEMKARIADLRFTSDMARLLRRAGSRPKAFSSDVKWRELERKYPAVHQPVVRVHPETGQPVLYVNEGHSLEITGMDNAEGHELLRALTDEFKRPEYQVRWSWENHSIAIWDNRAVQHYGVPDPQYDRYLERVTVMGAPPLSLREWDMAEQPG